MSGDRSAFSLPGSILPRRPARLDDLPWATVPGSLPGQAPMGVRVVVDDERHTVRYVKMPPNFTGRRHWHPSTTVYIITAGVLHVDDEDSYHAGGVRWVEGGVPYGPERAGPEGCEFYFVSLGPFGSFDPEEPQTDLGETP